MTLSFTDEQARVISHEGGNAVVIAGAGSGKTRCLVERTANLISNGVDESSILLFTFTKKAAKEIRQRIAKRLDKGEDELSVHVSTIHSLALRIFRDHAKDLDYENPTLWGPDRRGRLIREYYKECMSTKKNFLGDSFTCTKSLALIEAYRESGLVDTTEILSVLDQTLWSPVPSNISELWPETYYNNLLQEHGDELLATVCALFLKSKNVCGVIEFNDMQPAAIRVLNTLDTDWKTRFNHLMVDEYQDVNDTNVEFIQSLTHDGTESIMAVGDDDQAIYGFRGSNTEHILNFPSVFGGEVLYLTKNFRSSPEIINVANEVIQNNKNRYDKTMTPNKTDKGTVDAIFPYLTNDREIMYNELRKDVYLSIFQQIQGYIHFVGLDPSDIAILARNNLNLKMASYHFAKINRNAEIYKRRRDNGYQPQEEQEFLTPIPFQLNNILSILKRKNINRIFNVLSVLINPTDHISIREMLMNIIPGFGSRSAEYFMQEISQNAEGTLSEWLLGILNYPRHGPKTKLGKRIVHFENRFSEIQELMKSASILDIWKEVLCTIFNIEKRKEEFLKQLDNVIVKKQEFEDIKNVTEWLEEYALVTYELEDISALEGLNTLMDALHTEMEAFEQSENEVQMMTIHASKGKEWPVVFLLDLDQDTLPGHRYTDLEEERRLFYVGVTRAESCVIFCRAYEDENANELAPSTFWLESGVHTGDIEPLTAHDQ